MATGKAVCGRRLLLQNNIMGRVQRHSHKQCNPEYPAARNLCYSQRTLLRPVHISQVQRRLLTQTPINPTFLSVQRHSHESDGDNHGSTDKPMTHFGFSTVREDAKVAKVHDVFKRVAETYDLMNDVMSVGIHRLWKDEFVHQLSPHTAMNLLDVAGGTGDIAFRYMKYTSAETSSCAGTRQVTVCDINEHMLRVGKKRATEQGLTQGISWLQGNAECLPVESNTYDAYTIAFGIRNCTNIQKVLNEAYRVLKPGGRFMCLEFSQVRNSVLRAVYDQYSFQVIPVMGHVIAQDWASYQYLVESIRNFPNQETFASWITEAGFSSVSVRDMSLGIVAIHSGFKL